jgi:hypothetical protein
LTLDAARQRSKLAFIAGGAVFTIGDARGAAPA